MIYPAAQKCQPLFLHFLLTIARQHPQTAALDVSLKML
jgi:hypothetical protein